ncbi:hypothetical protein F7725_028115 [Dissostichus mawsoni]|uniref:Uncharacterized protein n=1 Tax=Dissostichus mawsoni TaxID=36200 RepID=A0A7J5XG19_DISMA|nr:hypothetical protein F7725_028115 [Dissostichus mawsoni]
MSSATVVTSPFAGCCSGCFSLCFVMQMPVRYKLLCWRGMKGLARGLGVQASIPDNRAQTLHLPCSTSCGRGMHCSTTPPTETRLGVTSSSETHDAAQSLTGLEAQLEALQCHFTWDLDPSSSKLFCLRDKLEDIGTEEGYSWLGHIYNLQGFIHYQLGFTDDAYRFFSRAAEAFRQIKNTVSDEAPWLVVNHGNLAWLHYHEGEQAESEAHLSKVKFLMNEYPSPSQEELHPEICAEKAWTLMKFSADKMLLAADNFQRAIRMQPDMVEWHTSHVIGLENALRHREKNMGADIFDKLKIAKKHDPDNLYLTALYFEACAKRGKKLKLKHGSWLEEF